jgi:hypothetical protein
MKFYGFWVCFKIIEGGMLSIQPLLVATEETIETNDLL